MPELILPNPHVAQAEVLRTRKRFNVLACGRRWGKTRLCDILAIVPAAKSGKPVGWFAPTYKLLVDAWDEISARVSSFAEVKKGENRVLFPSGGMIEFWSTEPRQLGNDESEVARGRKYARIVYDEAAHARRLKADWTRAIRPTLTDYQGDAWFPSTPRGMGYFHELFMRGQQGADDWASWRMPTSSNPHIAAEEIEAARRELPADAFAQEYEAEFLANAANPFGIDAIRACIDNTLTRSNAVAYWGIDLAKSHDWTVAIGLDAKGRMVAFQRWQGDWRQTRERLIAMVKQTPARIDSTGVGDPITEDICAKCAMAEGYHFTSQSKQRLMEGLAFAIQRREVSYPNEPVLLGELESFQYLYRPSGVRYSAPDGLHDDCVCALALAVECMRTSGPALSLDVVGVGSDRIAFDPWGDFDDD